MVYVPEQDAWAPCICQAKERYEKMLKQSGISEAFRQKTFENYIPKDNSQKAAKKIALDYATNFEKVRKTRNHSIAFTQQPGAGKTHLSIAIANMLMDMGIGVVYFMYKDVITYLKQVKMDNDIYKTEIEKYKQAPVLLIDDLFKLAERNGKVSDADVDIIYEIINSRYFNARPIILSTEKTIDDLIYVDEATGSRIAEMCKGRVLEFVGKELNHRI